ncbi:MAG TPA: fused MFS/spermidine synthase [Syntrophales bacterium]|nr:fused MFS/spermidine synthase [Syntrophales bacterium]
MGISLVHAMVFLGAFLLFGMEPLTGRLLVPYFGGAVHIWLVCLMYFQFLLLLGYLYAHLLAARAGRWHLALMLAPLLNLPLEMAATAVPTGDVWPLLATLTRHIALPFVVLSTTVVVVQLWVARSSLARPFNPYVLYATSNAGSLAALLGYPLLMEPFLGLRMQSLIWSGGYLLYLLAAAGVWGFLRPRLPQRPPPAGETVTTKWGTTPGFSSWLLLSFLSSALLVTVTNLVAMEIGSFPLVWVLPLALYLASFIITFRDGEKLSPHLMYFWLEIVALGIILFFIPASHWIFHLLLLCVLFLVCVMIHGDLYRRRPDSGQLTRFYFAVALGGFLGGASITLAAPLLFPGIYEYPLMLAVVAVIFGWRYRKLLFRTWSLRYASVLIIRLGTVAALYLVLILVSGANLAGDRKAAYRNYYGVSRIYDFPADKDAPAGVRILVHGSTMHGLQFRDRDREKMPTMYYHRRAGLGDVFAALPPPRRIAVVGLGAGTAGALTASGDTLDYYEIDPDMEMIARHWFSFLEHTPAKLRVIVGDGRLKLQQAGEKYDLILIDAFSGDGIPTHLITREALEIYRQRLAAHGLLVLHLTNRYYDLRPVVKAILADMKLPGVMKLSALTSSDTYMPIATLYLVISPESEELKPFVERGWIMLGEQDGLPPGVAWTDDYINILAPAAVKWRAK